MLYQIRTKNSKSNLSSQIKNFIETLLYESWKSKIFTIKRLKNTFCLIDNVKDVYICNNSSLITEYYNKPTQIRSLTTNKISLGWGKLYFLKDSYKKIVLNLNNIFFLFSNPFHLVSLGFLNIYKIFYDNKNKMLYNKKIKKLWLY